MNPTPEQVAQWAREAGLVIDGNQSGFDDLHRLVTHAMAEQAEADAKLCEKLGEDHFCEDIAYDYAHAIRANSPKA